MAEIEDDGAGAALHTRVEAASGKKRTGGNWGVWLFRATVVAAVVYSWWLLIYSHGIASHHP